MKKKHEKKKRVIDLRRFFDTGRDLTDNVVSDVDGSYTGMPVEYYYDDISAAEPIQDADDL